MTKLVIFDLDGVLVDSCNIHFESLNTALQEIAGTSISLTDHETHYNGLSTKTKLQKLNIEPSLHEAIFQRKQELTTTYMKTLPMRSDLCNYFQTLHNQGIAIWCASNCIHSTVETALTSIGVLPYLDGFLSNESVQHSKPAPDIYLECMTRVGASPQETLVFEDSFIGLKSAIRSGARVWKVESPHQLTPQFIQIAIESTRSNLMEHVNIVIPMAGHGSRFASVGYKDPKPFIPVFGKPMISWVVRNVGIDGHYIFVGRKEFNADTYLQSLSNHASVINVDKVTEGAACTVLLTRDLIDNEHPLIIINSDQYIEFQEGPTAFEFVFDFLYNPSQSGLSGKISTFDGQGHPKWSYAKTDEHGIVTEVREKDPFSEHATTGLYMWRHGRDFVNYANQMIRKNVRVNNEFYVVPVFNEAIADGHKLVISDCKRMWGIGVPEDLEYFLTNFKGTSTTIE